MNNTQRIISIFTYITGTFVIICYSIYLISCVNQQNYIMFFLSVIVITTASAAMAIRKNSFIWLKLILCAGMCFYMLTFSVFTVYIYSRPATNLVYDDRSVIAVFGCHTYGMTPGSVLSSRLDCAFKILEDYTSMLCIVSGGMGPNETVTEAESMREYLIQRGINPERIYIDDKSNNTIENMINIKELLDLKNLSDYDVIAVSSIYHLPRLRMLAEKYNISMITVSADTPNVFFTLSDTVREYMAWVKMIILNIYN